MKIEKKNLGWKITAAVLALVTLIGVANSGLLDWLSVGQLWLVGVLLSVGFAAIFVYQLRWTWDPSKEAVLQLGKWLRNHLPFVEPDEDTLMSRELDRRPDCVRTYLEVLSLAVGSEGAERMIMKGDGVSKDLRNAAEHRSVFVDLCQSYIAGLTDAEVAAVADFVTWLYDSVRLDDLTLFMAKARLQAREGLLNPRQHLHDLAALIANGSKKEGSES